MDCGHKFNYETLFKEIIIQKFIFRTYFNGFTNEERKKLKGSNIFIKCPYCRSLQTNILPYHKELNISKVYGVNTLDSETYFHTVGISNMSFNKYNKVFSIGKKCDFKEYTTNNQNIDTNTDISDNHISKKFCGCLYVTNLDGTSNHYCINHYYIFYKKMLQEQKAKKKAEEKQKKEEEKKKILEEKKKIQQDKLKEKLNEFEAKNAERVAKGLKPLKQSIKLTTKPINQEDLNYGEFEYGYCIAILTSGLRKGHQCGNKKVTNLYCGRHKEQQKIYDANNITNNSNINNIS